MWNKIIGSARKKNISLIFNTTNVFDALRCIKNTFTQVQVCDFCHSYTSSWIKRYHLT